MVISYDFGHGTKGDGGAVGILNEEKVVRAYGSVVINELMRQGHDLINCTPVDPNLGLSESLAYRVNKANVVLSQLHLCFHANAFNDANAHGSEVEVAGIEGSKYAKSILEEICKLGFTYRGVNTPTLYVTKNTNMPAVLIEPFFCTNAADVALYNPNTLGMAIAKGISNVIGGKNIITEPIKNVKINIVLELQRFLNNYGFTDSECHKLVEDGISGLRTKSALEKLKAVV